MLRFPLLKKKLKHKFVKNFFTLLSGSVLGQVIIFLTIPFLTRLFSEEVFGIYMLYSSTVFLSKIIVTLRYELAVILPKRDKDAINLFAFNIAIVFLLSLLLFLLIIIFHDNIVIALKIQKIAYFIYFVPLSAFFLGNITAFNYWNNRNDTFKNISIGLVSKSATMSVSQLLIGLSQFKTIGLVPGMIAGQFINLLVVIKLSIKRITKSIKHVSIKRMLYLASKYRDIPLFNTILNFTNTLSNELPVLLITRFFGLDAVGIYGLAAKVAKAPPGIIGQSISQVFFNEASKVYNAGGNLFELIKRTYKNLCLTSFVVFIPLFAISFFLDYIFGENWIDVGTYVRILLPWLFLGFLSGPVSSLIVILNKQRTILIYHILLLASRFTAIYLGYTLYNDILVSLMFFSAVGVFFNLLILIYFFRISKQSVHQKHKVYK